MKNQNENIYESIDLKISQINSILTPEEKEKIKQRIENMSEEEKKNLLDQERELLFGPIATKYLPNTMPLEKMAIKVDVASGPDRSVLPKIPKPEIVKIDPYKDVPKHLRKKFLKQHRKSTHEKRSAQTITNRKENIVGNDRPTNNTGKQYLAMGGWTYINGKKKYVTADTVVNATSVKGKNVVFIS